MPYVYDAVCPSCGQNGRADELCRFCWVLVPNPRSPEEETTDAPEGDAGEAGDDAPDEADVERQGYVEFPPG